MLDPATYRTIRIERDGAIAILTLNRPEFGNSIDDTMHSELSRVFVDLRTDREIRVAVLTGAGDTFCVGGDSSPGRTFTTLTGLTPIEEGRTIIETLLDLNIPLIAAVNGDALGLGAVLAGLADVSFMTRSGRIGDRHVAGGVTAGNGAAALWPAIIGLNRAKFLLLGARLLESAEAERIGLVHRVVDDAVPAALELAAEWAALPPFAVQSTKAILNTHLRAAAGLALRYGLAMEEQAMAGPEFQAALAARRAGSAAAPAEASEPPAPDDPTTTRLPT